MKTMNLCLGVLVLMAGSAHAVEFEDYDFSRWSQDVTGCDILAAHGRDPGHVSDPVTRETMHKDAAIAACQVAVAADPDNPRLNYQLGRAYGYSGRGEDAMPYRLKALEADYPQSTFVIGYLYLIGQTIDQNTCKALKLWQRSAKHRRLAALIALPRHYLRGDFAECGVDLSASELRDYLNEAKAVSGDFYVGMLADELLTKIPADE